jgi:hypothetical protein
MIALRIATLLGNGMGGMDWAGLPLLCGWIGVTDPDALIVRLEIIRKYHRPDSDARLKGND